MACNKPQRDLYPETLVEGFDLLNSEQTGIDFSNTIRETKSFNHYYFFNIYMGSGVAIGDINNDGLSDIFFGGNQVADRLYLNKGNFKFEDITKKSKVAKNNGWTWGVTMADVNSDGYLDIYVSRGGISLKLEDCRNQLYINNQDETFTEAAIAYGLADVGYSTQAVFFDMDNDGDLDMYQVNQVADKKLMLINKFPPKRYKDFLDRLYRNDNGKFKDVSEEVGISRDFAYGLSVNASDFNNDGWIDLYVANDHAEPDFMYYNNGDGTFKNVIHEKFKHISNFSMGSDAGDVNNDGLIDLLTTDMSPEDHYRSKTNMRSMSTESFYNIVNAGAHYQYMANALQINTGAGSFSDIANLAGTSNTDWSWSSLLVDLNNDGLKDIIISNGSKKDVENSDYLNLLNNIDSKNITAEELFQISKSTPSQPLANYAFKNNGNFKFEKVSDTWGFDTPSFSNGMAYGDLDNDGDLDVVTNNIDKSAFVYRNNTTGNFLKIKLEGPDNNKFGIGAKAIIHYGKNIQVAENMLTRGFISSVEPGLFFGLAKETRVDKVEVVWNDGKVNTYEDVGANRTISARYDDAINPPSKKTKETNTLLTQVDASGIGLDFKHKENEFDDFEIEILLPHKLSNNGPFTAVADVNGDGLDDAFVGGASGQSGALYLQVQAGKFELSKMQPWKEDIISEDLGALFLDVDGDNDLDLFVASGGNEFKQGSIHLKDRLYINDGSGVFVKSAKSLPNIFESSQCVKASDIDNDGDEDLFIGTRLIAGKYPFPATSYILLNENGQFKKSSKDIAPDLLNIGMVSDAAFTDIDNDGDEDLMIVGEWMNITLLTNDNGTFNNSSKKFGLENTRGLWWSITADDIDGDGDQDFIVGNLGKNNKFKATKEHPFKVYANDFDENGTNDVVLAKYYKDDYVPVRGRECTSQQMPFVAEKFKDYHSFASSKLLDILPEDKVETAVIYEINNFESIILINDDGILKRKPLPIQAQVSPIKSSIIDDFNNDGFKDILIVGNHYGVEVETVRYDAGYGLILLGDDNKNFNPISPIESGVHLPYDTRSINQIKINDKKAYLITSNNDILHVLIDKKDI
ncbi:VCBS repeat-containing protein [Flaviramulus aquimarinus]|uniref:VCBS repeat-containing protein n=1 Tax=Flaviramulus aquimarinus TaxID=1170456 RepID=A0ABP9F0Q0_9FLAO